MSQIHQHYSNRSPLIRAAVMGANDGIISISGFIIALAASGLEREQIVLSTISALIVGGLSMGAGEYISVSAQLDSEKADIAREKESLTQSPQQEFDELVSAFIAKGLDGELATKVVKQLSSQDPITHHLHEELGLSENNLSTPKTASFVSFTSFLLGGGIPCLGLLIESYQRLSLLVYILALICLLLLGYISSIFGGSQPIRAMARIFLVSLMVMFLSSILGKSFL